MVAAVFLLAAVAPASAGDRVSIGFDSKQGVLGVADGKPCLVSPRVGDHYWSATIARKVPVSMSVIEPRKWRGSYLAYDPRAKGKDKGAVLLADEPGDGTEWRLAKVKGESDTYTVRAASGAVEGWYLDVEAEGKEFKTKDGKKATLYRVILSEKPKKLPKWELSVISP